jgi:hypothetical protein
MSPARTALVPRAVSTLVVVLAISASAAAQTRVRVLHDRTMIWRRDARIPATTVKAGTLLDVVGQEADWYIVLIPAEYGGTGEAGLIAVSAVEAVAGSSPLRPPGRGPARPAPPLRATTRSVARPRPIEVFGSGQVGLSTWLARQTFTAVLGKSNGPMFGAAIEMRLWGRVFLEGAVERFERTGQRVFVSDGNVFNLGIRDTVRIIPVSATAGYRHDFKSLAAYAGGGAGRYFYRETSDFADPSDTFTQRFTSYHALAGVEFGGPDWLRTAFEVQLTSVPNALGISGASAAFGEHNLGGAQFRIKIMAGR